MCFGVDNTFSVNKAFLDFENVLSLFIELMRSEISEIFFFANLDERFPNRPLLEKLGSVQSRRSRLKFRCGETSVYRTLQVGGLSFQSCRWCSVIRRAFLIYDSKQAVSISALSYQKHKMRFGWRQVRPAEGLDEFVDGGVRFLRYEQCSQAGRAALALVEKGVQMGVCP